MFFNNLGNLAIRDINDNKNEQSSFGVTNSSFIDANSSASVSILNLQNDVYWLGEEYVPDTSAAWFSLLMSAASETAIRIIVSIVGQSAMAISV